MQRRTKILILIAVIVLLAGIAAAGLLLRVNGVSVGGHTHYSSEEVEAPSSARARSLSEDSS